jgi:hypothetical protein
MKEKTLHNIQEYRIMRHALQSLKPADNKHAMHVNLMVGCLPGIGNTSGFSISYNTIQFPLSCVYHYYLLTLQIVQLL